MKRCKVCVKSLNAIGYPLNQAKWVDGVNRRHAIYRKPSGIPASLTHCGRWI